jgi:uncharacterized protein YbjT (DUF2867 family)
MDKRIIPHKVLVIGATGLVGSKVVELLENEISVSKIIVVGRTIPEFKSSKIEFHLFDFQDYSKIGNLFNGVYAVFCCVGTTIKKAGNIDNFRKVDFDIPVECARLCEKANVNSFIVLSSLGANSKSSNYYFQTKGEMEEYVSSFKIHKKAFFRPSILLGPRAEPRPLESITKNILHIFSFLMVGVFRKFRPIPRLIVAKAMVRVAYSSNNMKVYENEEIRWIGR